MQQEKEVQSFVLHVDDAIGKVINRLSTKGSKTQSGPPCATVVQWSGSFLLMQINRVRLPATLLPVSLYHFFFLFGLFFFNIIFSFGLFFFILTADPAGHALGSIYISSLSPEFYFGKGIQKLLICILAKLTTR